MNPTWDGAPPPEHLPPTFGDRLRLAWRLPVILSVLTAGMSLKGLVRLVEYPLHGPRRPWSPRITVIVCRIVLAVMGLRVTREGTPLAGPGAQVANHTSWLDIFVLNAGHDLYFVAKSEVAGWPGIGWLARATGTLFILRDRRAAADQATEFRRRLAVGHRLMFFPEGTSTDGQRVLPFKTTLFASVFDPELLHLLRLQAVSVTYEAPPGRDLRFYGWWGDMTFGPSLLQIVAQRRQGRVRVIYHPPVRVDEFANRKSLARHLEDQVREGHDRPLLRSGPAS